MYAKQAELAAFIRERYEKEAKYFKVYETHNHNFKKTLLTSKFYSKYEVSSHDDADPVLMEKIKKIKYDTPKERYPWPLTENQSYGWFTEPLVDEDRQDHRYYHPRICNDFIKHYLKLKMEESVLPKVKYTGLPFKVQ